MSTLSAPPIIDADDEADVEGRFVADDADDICVAFKEF
jgi:hypothetical protein